MSERAPNALDDLVARLERMHPDDRAEVLATADTDCGNFLWVPNIGPQTDAYLTPAQDLGYGGEAGGGKSDLLIGVAVNEHDVSQIFRLQHNDRVALVRRLAEIWEGTDMPEGTRPPGYNAQEHMWRAPRPCGERGRRPIIEFGALALEGAWQHYQGRPASLKAWDELPQFARNGYITVNAWNRSVDALQRCRTIAAMNPPTTVEGLWVIEHWAPWLDDRHPNPARFGELRYFTTIGDEQVEVPPDWEGVDAKGRIIKPRSRTFIRAALEDNPDLNDTDYASVLAALPKELREALAEGKFRASFEDDHMQVIPTAWVIAAQERWQKRAADHSADPNKKGKMTGMGVDAAGGGKARQVMAPWYGTFCDKLESKAGTDVRDPRDAAAAIFFYVRDDAPVKIDNTGGWGAGAAAILMSNKHPVVLCNFAGGSRARARDGSFFVNKRAEYYWMMREALDPVNGDNLALPPGRGLLQELCAVKWKRVKLDGRPAIQLEAKELIEKRLGRSPDEADAVVLGWAERDAFDGWNGRDGFHPLSNRGEVRTAHSNHKSRSREWRNRNKGFRHGVSGPNHRRRGVVRGGGDPDHQRRGRHRLDRPGLQTAQGGAPAAGGAAARSPRCCLAPLGFAKSA